VKLTADTLTNTYMASIVPYLHAEGINTDMLAGLKAKEAILLLLRLDPQLKNLLFDFSEPGKIDLEAYMNKHFNFNVEMKRFAYLTGRSLATFKRDFEKIFHTSPNRWLQQKRLNEAYYLIREKGKKPSEVYLEVGFEDFSHFSYAFKKAFGTPPSLV
jgi:AraC-like DNA-binding protein